MSIYPISKKEKVFHTDWNRLISILFNMFYKATGSNIKGLVLSGMLLTRRTVSRYSLTMQVFILCLQLPQTWKSKTHGITLKKDHVIMCTQRQGKKISRISNKTKKQKKKPNWKNYWTQMPNRQTVYGNTIHAQTLLWQAAQWRWTLYFFNFITHRNVWNLNTVR